MTHEFHIIYQLNGLKRMMDNKVNQLIDAILLESYHQLELK